MLSGFKSECKARATVWPCLASMRGDGNDGRRPGYASRVRRFAPTRPSKLSAG